MQWLPQASALWLAAGTCVVWRGTDAVWRVARRVASVVWRASRGFKRYPTPRLRVGKRGAPKRAVKVAPRSHNIYCVCLVAVFVGISPRGFDRFYARVAPARYNRYPSHGPRYNRYPSHGPGSWAPPGQGFATVPALTCPRTRGISVTTRGMWPGRAGTDPAPGTAGPALTRSRLQLRAPLPSRSVSPRLR